jgi:ketosteroid isomerase-like protein
MDDQTADRIMRRFAGAFFRRDPALLGEVVTDDVEWHFAIGEDGPDGRVRRGVQGLLQGAEENAKQFEQLRFDDVACRALGDDGIVMTYLVRAQPRGGAPFAVRGVELIALRDGRIAKKDVFWKQRRLGG